MYVYSINLNICSSSSVIPSLIIFKKLLYSVFINDS